MVYALAVGSLGTIAVDSLSSLVHDASGWGNRGCGRRITRASSPFHKRSHLPWICADGEEDEDKAE
jgi:hypothetical protein